MANNLLTNDHITRMAVALFKNSNNFIQQIPTTYSNEFVTDGAKNGTQIRIRLPNDYTVSTGSATNVQDTNEQNTTLVVATQKNIGMSLSSVDRTMKVDDFSEIFLQPAVNNLVGEVGRTIMNDTANGICNLVANVDASNVILNPNMQTFLNAGASLSNNSAPVGPRKIINSPDTEAATVSSLSGLLNPSSAISKQYMEGMMYKAIGFDWYMDQTVINHTVGTFTAGTVSGAGQTGTTLVTSAITGTLKKGDIITLALVNAVNRVTKADLGKLRQFVVTADVASGATSIPIYPAIVPAVAGVAVQYQTVTVSPADTAAILLVLNPSQVYSANFAYAPSAITMTTVDLEMPPNVDAARRVYNGISLRTVTQYQVGTDFNVTRLDVLFGSKLVRPEWATVVPGIS